MYTVIRYRIYLVLHKDYKLTGVFFLSKVCNGPGPF